MKGNMHVALVISYCKTSLAINIISLKLTCCIFNCHVIQSKLIACYQQQKKMQSVQNNPYKPLFPLNYNYFIHLSPKTGNIAQQELVCHDTQLICDTIIISHVYLKSPSPILIHYYKWNANTICYDKNPIHKQRVGIGQESENQIKQEVDRKSCNVNDSSHNRFIYWVCTFCS